MQNRERGAAHINIYYFLVLLVLFLGALWFGYVQLTANKDLERAAQTAINDEKEAREQLAVYVDYVNDITAIIGEEGQYKGKQGKKYQFTVKPIPKASLPSKVKTIIKNFTDRQALPSTAGSPLGNLLNMVSTQIAAEKTRAGNAETARTAAQTAKSQADAAYRTSINTANTNLQTANTNFAQQRAVATAEDTRQKGRIANLANEIRTLGETIKTQRDQHQVEITKVRKAKNLLELQLEHLQGLTRTINPPDQPDGSIINASMKAGVAWIDVGRKDMLPLGTVFRISAPRIDGRAQKGTKAFGTVISVKQDRAQLRLWAVADRYDPVVHGDVITNELYTPHLKRNIALIGRFSYPYPKPEVKRLLERLGNKVLDKVDVGVDLVIVGNGTVNESGDGLTNIKETDEYKFAENHRIEIIPLNRIRDLLKLN